MMEIFLLCPSKTKHYFNLTTSISKPFWKDWEEVYISRKPGPGVICDLCLRLWPCWFWVEKWLKSLDNNCHVWPKVRFILNTKCCNCC
jgi:hypothetical protein